MDPLSALAIAAAVVQFVDFGGRMLARGYDIGKRALHESAGAELRNLAQQLSSLTVALHEALDGLPRGSAITPAQAKLRRACAMCDDISNEFQQAAFAGSGLDSTKISLMKGKLVDAKAMVMETVLFCLWYVQRCYLTDNQRSLKVLILTVYS